MVKKKYIIIPIIMLAILLAMNTLSLTPLGRTGKFFGALSGYAGIVLLVVFFRKFPRDLRKFSIYFLILLVISVLSSNIIYGQSIVRGIFTNSGLQIAGTALLVYYLFLKFKIRLAEGITWLLGLSWIVFIVFAYLYLTGFTYTNEAGHEFEFSALQKGVINIGSLIYLTFFFERNKNIYLFYSLLFFSVNHWFDFQRFLFFIYMISMATLFFIYRKERAGVRFLAVVLFVFPMLIVGLAGTNFGQQFIEKYAKVLSFLEDPEDKVDSSLNARVIEMDVATKSIQEYPITGVGRLSKELKEKATKTDYFYISDIGLVGIWFAYGLFGLIIYIFQWRYLIVTFRREKLFVPFKIILFYYLIFTSLTGKTINEPIEFFLMITFIEIGRRELEQSRE